MVFTKVRTRRPSSIDNGKTWTPLADGYDASFDSTAWLPRFESGAGETALFRTHEFVLKDIFPVGEIVLLRFRLFSDANINGWGWAIDI